MSLDWLVARPIAHRGLHDRDRRIVENTLGAAMAAAAGAFAIECDAQWSRDGEAMVFHDFSMERLTLGEGRVADHDCAALQRLPLRDSGEFMPTLGEYLAAIAGRVPLVCEIKSRFDGDMRLADRCLDIVAGHVGPVAFKSFDPDVIAHLRARGAAAPLGIVAEARYDHPEWATLSPQMKLRLIHFLHFEATRPDFLSWHVEDLPHATPHLWRAALGRPVMAWTVRQPRQRELAQAFADQIVFEGFTP